MIDPACFIDTERYPVDKPGTDQFTAMIEGIHDKLAEDGCAVLKGFLKQAALPQFVAEADAAAPNAHNSRNRTNPYFSKDDDSLDASHPRRRFYDRSNAFIPADNFGQDSALRVWREIIESGSSEALAVLFCK